jgi:hypothetical protein
MIAFEALDKESWQILKAFNTLIARGTENRKKKPFPS